MKNSYDVIVVGGGPAGSMAAWEAAKGGASVCILEKDRDIGYPVRCGEAASDLGLKQFVEPQESWIAERISGAVIVSPNGSRVDVKFAKESGYILNRRIFDYDLSRYASNAGAEIYTKAFVKELIIEDGFVKGIRLDHLSEEKTLSAKIVIGADGVNSRIGRMADIKTQIRMKDMESCVQYSVSNVEIEPNKMIMYVGENYAPGGYLWVFPKGDKFANIGIGISGKHSKYKSAKRYLDEFMEREFPQAAILTTMCGGVPCAKPIKRPIKNGLMLVGDAAHQVNPMTGGGIVSGMKGGWLAGKVAADAIKQADYSEEFLGKYADDLRKDFGKNHEKFYKIKEATTQLTKDDFDSIAEKVLKTPFEKRTLASIFKAAVFKKPSLIVDVLKVLSGV
jgi:digeranylgeranylglycerophospholipid reductase